MLNWAQWWALLGLEANIIFDHVHQLEEVSLGKSKGAMELHIIVVNKRISSLPQHSWFPGVGGLIFITAVIISISSSSSHCLKIFILHHSRVAVKIELVSGCISCALIFVSLFFVTGKFVLKFRVDLLQRLTLGMILKLTSNFKFILSFKKPK